MKKLATKAPKKLKKLPTVLVNFILDSSGSMDATRKETVSAFNSYLKNLGADKEAKYAFTLTVFSTSIGVDRRTNAVALSDVYELDNTNYVPAGYTPLYDAIGMTVRDVEDEAKKFDKVLTVIMTDGEENRSKDYDKPRIQALIKEKEALGNWSFSFLGAGIEAWDAGVKLGIPVASTIRYGAGQEQAVGMALSSATMSYAHDSSSMTRSLFAGMSKLSAEVTPEDLDNLVTQKRSK